jgi:hypothetical protein
VPVKKKIYRNAHYPNLGGNSSLNRHVMEQNTVYLTMCSAGFSRGKFLQRNHISKLRNKVLKTQITFLVGHHAQNFKA